VNIATEGALHLDLPLYCENQKPLEAVGFLRVL
jgi:hypothetical protein